MGKTPSSVGMMEGAFFVSRSELLSWVNDLLKISMTKVEQCASGAVYCQIIDSCHPGTVSMKKVNWIAKAEHEFIPNYKVLQAAFDRNSIDKHIEVDKLIRSKYQDNLEFLQWTKWYHERQGGAPINYDAVAAREGRPMLPWGKFIRHPEKERAGKENTDVRNIIGRSLAKRNQRAISPLQRPIAGARSGSKGGAQCPPTRPHSAHAEIVRATDGEQDKDLEELRYMLSSLQHERDYYFRRLRNVEILCSSHQASMGPGLTAEKVIEDIQGILLACDEDEDAVADLCAPVGELQEA
eukprot:gnl/TRDRNA2_/TRDRNA2_200672_c0_seq1.p1 gnl/TRDRNA2_/TRDRNA2_200672_c0~~gnl/TRDRNA2_/TRDRNA2_200672_c0_seq1.p1  ORF type:complete len:296 (+),score=44.85 gnl/TRDRNA2_/TRDRNA2_200672_c0_seq1:60-947(+)